MSSNTLHRITDFTGWPVLRCFPLEFLSQVSYFYADLGSDHSRYYLLFVCTNGNVYQTEVDVIPKSQIALNSLTEIPELHGVTLSSVTCNFTRIMAITEAGDLYIWRGRESFLRTPLNGLPTCQQISARNVLKVCSVLDWILILYRNGTLAHGTITCNGIEAQTTLHQATNICLTDIESSIAVTGKAYFMSVWMALARTSQNTILTWRYSSNYNAYTFTRFSYSVPSNLRITSAAFVTTALLYVTTGGECYLAGRRPREKPVKLFKLEDPGDPIEKIYTTVEYQTSSCAILVSRTGRIYVANFDGMKFVRVTHSSLSSVPNAIGLYWFHPQTVALTTIDTTEAASRMVHFNNPFEGFPLCIAYFQFPRQSSKRVVFVDSALLQSRSDYLAKMFQYHWRKSPIKNNVKNNVVNRYRYPVYFSYLYYHHSDSLSHLELDLALELLQLAIDFKEIQLADQCRHFIRENLSTENVFRLYPTLKAQTCVKDVIGLVPWCVELDNFARWLNLAHHHRDHLLLRHVARFVRVHFDQVIRHPCYISMKPHRWHAIMITASKLIMD